MKADNRETQKHSEKQESEKTGARFKKDCIWLPGGGGTGRAKLEGVVADVQVRSHGAGVGERARRKEFHPHA